MNAFLVMARFRPGTEMHEVYAVVEEEKAQALALRDQGRVGAIHISSPRQTVFIETFADDEAGAQATVETLPMSRWWDLDVFPVTLPPSAEQPS